MTQITQPIVITQLIQNLPTNNTTSTTQPMVITLLNLKSMFGITSGMIQGSSQNSGFGIFGQNVKTSNPGWQPFGNLEEGSSSAGNNNFNNPSPISLFGNLEENNFNNLPLPANLFGNLGGSNSSPNNNNLSGGLNSNVVALVNALIGINLTGGHYPREGSFIKPTKFEGIETEDPNE